MFQKPRAKQSVRMMPGAVGGLDFGAMRGDVFMFGQWLWPAVHAPLSFQRVHLVYTFGFDNREKPTVLRKRELCLRPMSMSSLPRMYNYCCPRFNKPVRDLLPTPRLYPDHILDNTGGDDM